MSINASMTKVKQHCHRFSTPEVSQRKKKGGEVKGGRSRAVAQKDRRLVEKTPAYVRRQ